MRSFGILFALTLATGCGTTAPPQELVDARTAYNHARNGPAAQLDPPRVQQAGAALERAEASFRDDGSSEQTRDLAVVAQLAAQAAEARAEELVADHKKDVAAAELRALEASKIAEAQAAAAEREAERQRMALEAERQRRMDLEKKLSEVVSAMGKMGTLTQTDRGLVITLHGDALFAPNDTKLKKDALPKLDVVADAIRGRDHGVSIEGHGDAPDVSEKRAGAVRDYLVSRGVPPAALTATGYGTSKPIVDDKAPGARAANRRIEIVIEAPPPKPTAPMR